MTKRKPVAKKPSATGTQRNYSKMLHEKSNIENLPDCADLANSEIVKQ